MAQYSDIDLNFNIHPVKKDLSKKTDDEAVKQSLKTLVLTNFYERPFQPNLGSNLFQLLFDNFTPLTRIKLEDAIKEVINNYEPRVSIISVDVNEAPQNNAIDVTIFFNISNQPEPVELNILLKRIR